MRRRVEAEEEQDRAFKQKRMDMLINLKGSITANRVSHDYPGERVNVLCICVSFTCIFVLMVWLLYVCVCYGGFICVIVHVLSHVCGCCTLCFLYVSGCFSMCVTVTCVWLYVCGVIVICMWLF